MYRRRGFWRRCTCYVNMGLLIKVHIGPMTPKEVRQEFQMVVILNGPRCPRKPYYKDLLMYVHQLWKLVIETSRAADSPFGSRRRSIWGVEVRCSHTRADFSMLHGPVPTLTFSRAVTDRPVPGSFCRQGWCCSEPRTHTLQSYTAFSLYRYFFVRSVSSTWGQRLLERCRI